MKIPIEVKSRFDRSDTVDAHIERHLGSALRPYARHVRHVELTLRDANGPRGGADDKVARVGISFNPGGRIVATATAADVYASISRAAARARAAVARYVDRADRAGRRAAARSR